MGDERKGLERSPENLNLPSGSPPSHESLTLGLGRGMYDVVSSNQVSSEIPSCYRRHPGRRQEVGGSARGGMGDRLETRKTRKRLRSAGRMDPAIVISLGLETT